MYLIHLYDKQRSLGAAEIAGPAQASIAFEADPYSVATELRSRVLDFFKSPRPMVLALKAFFEIFEAYPVLKFLSKDQIKDRLSSPKEHYSKK